MSEAVAVRVPEFRLIARDPQELEAARVNLSSFFAAKVKECEAESAAIDENLQIALKFPIKTQPLKAALNRINLRRRFYEKCRAAVDAGFHIIPNFNADVFAIRTKREATGMSRPDTWGGERNAIARMPTQKAQALEVGEGRYVSPIPVGYAESFTEQKDGKTITKHYATVADFAEIDFPFIFARPEVLSATQQLMADKIFDELGALPQTQRNADPMVVGIIRESSARNAKVMTFLAIWFLDTKTL